MSSSAVFETKDPEDREIWILCGVCGRETCHRVLAWVHWTDESPGGDIQVWEDHLTVLCQGCHTVSFCVESRCSEEWVFDPDSERQILKTTRKYFPSRVEGRPKMEDMRYLPSGVYSIYEEAHGALCNDFQIMAGFGVRAIVEAVCKDKKMPGKDLKQRIDSLASAGLITKEGADILHSLRFMGNKAAHEMKAHTALEMNAAFAVVEHLLQGVYILPRHAEDLPKKDT